MKLIAVEGCELSCVQGGIATIESDPSKAVKINGNGIYFDSIEISVKGSSAGGAAGNASGTGKLNLTASKTKASGKFVCLEGDEAQIVVNGSNPLGMPTSGIEVVKIEKAGQKIVKGI